MKKANNFYEVMVPCGNYFIEDISEIYEILAANFPKVVISTEEFEFDDLEDLKKFKGPIKKMRIFANDKYSETYISISFDIRVRIYLNKDTTLARGVAGQIAELARKRVKRFYTSINAFIIYQGIMGGVIGFTISQLYIKGVKIEVVLIVVLEMLLLSYLFYKNRKHVSTIKLTSKYETQNFFKTNSDKIIIAVIAAIVGALVTAAIPFLIG